MTSGLTYALFDLDQTLVDRRSATRVLAETLLLSDAVEKDSLNQEWAIDEFLRLDKNGYQPDKVRMFTDLEKSWRGLKRSPEELSKWLRQAPRTWYQPDDQVVALLRDLSERKITWGIVTNGPPTQSDKAARIGVLQGATCFVVSEIVGVAKPDPEIFEIALRGLGAPAPEEVLFIGDNPHADISGSKAIGMKTAWLHHGNSWPNDLPQPDHIIDSVLDCAQLFD